MPTPLPPVDTSVELPASVRRAAAAANNLHKQAYGDGATPPQPQPQLQPEPQPAPQPQPAPEPQPQPQPVAQPAPEPAPQPQPAPQPEPEPEPGDNLTAEQWKHRYLSMKGRYEQSQVNNGQMQEIMSQMGDELARVNQRAPAPATVPPTPPQPPMPPRPRVTKQDVDTYGPELIDLARRAALDAVTPELQTVRQETRQANQRVTQVASQAFYADLDQSVPEWRAINVNPRFKVWCQQLDVYSGQVRGQLLNAAVKAADAPRAAAFFKGFLTEEQATGNAPAPQPQPAPVPPRQAAVSLETLTAPGRPKPAPGNPPGPAADKPTYTRAQIAWFYSQAGRQYYTGREDERKADEQELFRAQREGRVR